MTWFRQHFFSCTLVLLLVLAVTVSYVRFMVLNDYVVAYEGDCDPYTESCFIGCEDDECTEEYYYSVVQKYAPDVEAQCGTDITDCDAAYECLPEDGDRCTVTYCDPGVEEAETCEELTEADFVEEAPEEDLSEEDVPDSEESLDTADELDGSADAETDLLQEEGSIEIETTL